MLEKEFNISNESYTNKDFYSIYPQLLQLVKKLTYKWDPSISNESDPGVVLLKLNALIADKNNYNIDKNVLETFPLSVTQYGNAMQLFKQLGYVMKWYKAATSDSVLINWIRNNENQESINDFDTLVQNNLRSNLFVYVPRFTQITDSNNQVIYTTLQGINVPLNGDTVPVKVIQGTVNQLTINQESVITYNYLDDNNRIYINKQNVAENGIFIVSYGDTALNKWKKVKNLVTQPLGGGQLNSQGQYVGLNYEFGVSQDGDFCYIQFPENIAQLIKDGIYIYYTLTDGVFGNVNANNLSKFTSNVSSNIYTVSGATESTVALNQTTININNTKYITNGENPQTIDSAYQNYKRTIHTFDTLVTLRDYINYIYQNCHYQGGISNALVFDRKNDPQTSYFVFQKINQLYQKQYKNQINPNNSIYPSCEFSGINKDSNNIVTLTVKSKSNVRYSVELNFDITNHNQCFKVFIDDTVFYKTTNVDVFTSTQSLAQEVNNDINNKFVTIQYNRNQLLAPIWLGKSEIRYMSKGIVQDYLDAFDLKLLGLKYIENIYTLDNVSSGSIKQVPYDISFQPMTNDELSLVKLQVQQNKSVNHDFTNILPYRPIFYKNIYPIKCRIVPNYRVTTIQAVEILQNIKQQIAINYNSRAVQFGQRISYDELYDIISNADKRIKSVVLDRLSYQTYAVYFQEDEKGQLSDIKQVKINTEQTQGPLKITESSTDQDKLIRKFQIDIWAKSILAGVTPLWQDDTKYKYGFNQHFNMTLDNVVSATTQLTIIPTPTGTDSQEIRTINLLQNQNLIIYSPNYSSQVTYSGYTKYDCNFDLARDTIYRLQQGDKIVFFFKENEQDPVYSFVTYDGLNTAESPIIKSNFDVTQTVQGETDYHFSYSSGYPIPSDNCGVLSGNKQISKLALNKTSIDTQQYCYWITNSFDVFSDSYVLFDTNETQKLLTTGQYFIYCGGNNQSLNVFGQGTTITRPNTATQKLQIKSAHKSFAEIYSVGFQSISSYALRLTYNIETVQNVLYTFGNNVQVKFNVDKSPVLSFPFSSGSKFKPDIQSIQENTMIGYRDKTISSIGDYTYLPNLLQGQQYKCFTLLNINMSVENPQVITNTQTNKEKITIEYDYDFSENTSTIKSFPENDQLESKIYIQSSQEIILRGGENLSLFSYDFVVGDYVLPSMYVYSLQNEQSTADNKITIQYSNLAKLPIKNAEYYEIITNSTEQEWLNNDYYFYKTFGGVNQYILIDKEQFPTYASAKYQAEHAEQEYDQHQVRVYDGNVYYYKYSQEQITLFEIVAKSTYTGKIAGQSISISYDNSTHTLSIFYEADSEIFDLDDYVSQGTNPSWAELLSKINSKYVNFVNIQDYYNVQPINYDYEKLQLNNPSQLFNFVLPAGKYIMPIYNPLKMPFSVVLSDSTTSSVVTSINFALPENTINLYYLLDITENSQQIQFNINNDYLKTEEVYLLIKQLKKIKEIQYLSDDYSDIYDRMFDLDTDKNYDYSYQVDQSKVIKNPLVADQFLNFNHIYNYCTICQLDTRINKVDDNGNYTYSFIQVTDKIK